MIELLDAGGIPRIVLKQSDSGGLMILDKDGHLRADLSESGSGSALTLGTEGERGCPPFRASANITDGRSTSAILMTTDCERFYVEADKSLAAKAPTPTGEGKKQK